ncbi:hypothetical protein diail_10120, partial [Diaporthe ilicicola]
MAPSKRGLGWPYDNEAGAFKPFEPAVKDNALTWLFNWEMWKPQGFPSGLTYVPQVRTAAEAGKIDQFLGSLGKVSHFIGFNEPDHPGQANMSVAQAVQLWKQHVLPAKKKYGFKLGSPAMTNSPAGKKWLQDFLKQLGGDAQVDFIVVHWYGLDVNNLKQFIEDMHKTFNKPIWLNEFACTTFGGKVPSQQDVEKFEHEALKYLDGQAFVEKYAWFGAATHDGSMGGVATVNKLANNGNLTSVGKIYCAKSENHAAVAHAMANVATNAVPESKELSPEPVAADSVTAESVDAQAHPQVHLNIVSRAVAAPAKPGINLTNKSKKEETYQFFNNYWNGNGTAGANFDHPEKPTHLRPGESKFVELPESFKGRVQRGKLIPATWVEFQLSASNDHKAWGNISLQQGYDGPAMISSTDGTNNSIGFTNDILPGAPQAAKQKRSDGKECLASTMGNWMGGPNQAAIDYENKAVGQKKAYIVGGSGTVVVNSKNKRLA